MSREPLATTFVASDGTYYTASEVCQHLAENRWRTCLRDTENGRELVEDERGELLMLVPAEKADLGGAVSEHTEDAD